ncbi:MAG: hypothetical protein LVQ95_00090 [Candidatus Micrarchaeales archaeon]|nr:hypothetical protein [Candidatus Micrarchaeales archaeon]
MGEYIEKEYCRGCGAQVTQFSRRYSMSRSDYYCAKCAARFDAEYTIAHTCSICKRSLKDSEHKMVMPSKLYGDEPMPFVHRIICMGCYQKLGYRDMDTSTMRNRLFRVRSRIRRSIAKRQVERQLKTTVSAA